MEATNIFPNYPNFPPELLLIILAHIRSLSPHPPKPPAITALVACARVRKSWYPLARQILFSFPNLVEPNLLSFRETVHRSPIHAECVRSLHIIPPRRDLHTLVHLIATLPNLRELFISKPLSEPSLEPSLISLLENGPSILSFRINAPASLILSFISCWSSLQFLDVSTRSPAPLSLINDLPPKPPFSLYELRWDVDLLTPKDLLDAEWVLSNSLSSLNILGLRKPITAQFFEKLVTHKGCALRSLRFVYFPLNFIPHLPSATKLEELSILDTPTTDLLQSIPQSIQHLDFTVSNTGFPFEEFESFLSSHANMRALTIQQTRCLEVEAKERLKWLIRGYDLDAKLYEDNIWMSKLPEDEKMEPVSKFPRYSLICEREENVFFHRRGVMGRNSS